MDLERLGAPELGELLLDRYAEHTADPAPAALRAHYVAYRAFVRVKVAWPPSSSSTSKPTALFACLRSWCPTCNSARSTRTAP
jgi:aminoglycoside phosphotransferase family enzyme